MFCQIIDGEAPATIVRRWSDAVAIVPLGPVTPGHLLVIPTVHVRDALADPSVTAAVFPFGVMASSVNVPVSPDRQKNDAEAMVNGE